MRRTRYHGILRHGKNRYRAQIAILGVVYYLGWYHTAEDAARAFDTAVFGAQYFRRETRYNFPDEWTSDKADYQPYPRLLRILDDVRARVSRDPQILMERMLRTRRQLAKRSGCQSFPGWNQAFSTWQRFELDPTAPNLDQTESAFLRFFARIRETYFSGNPVPLPGRENADAVPANPGPPDFVFES